MASKSATSSSLAAIVGEANVRTATAADPGTGAKYSTHTKSTPLSAPSSHQPAAPPAVNLAHAGQVDDLDRRLAVDHRVRGLPAQCRHPLGEGPALGVGHLAHRHHHAGGEARLGAHHGELGREHRAGGLGRLGRPFEHVYQRPAVRGGGSSCQQRYREEGHSRKADRW